MMDFCSDGECRAVLDTGTSLLAVPSPFADELQQELEGPLRDPPGRPPITSGSSEDASCKEATGALLHFDIEDGTILTLGPGDYARQAIRRQGDEQMDAIASVEDAFADESTCKPMIMPIDLPEPLGPKLFILGEPILRKYYTIYNWKEKRIGFGLAAHAEEEERPTAATAAPLLRAKPLLQDV